ncbi:Sre G protein-coupled chemoreceptor [Oesophagostomum dentatum]|uniref:Sre G protein-coupled chemoreceptor n=1 Tax=Oesophagostomum dentatum TaxID=61180 RepID=A0A0B1THL7_OESDE|nr:Sre G protein-coupled chemoreceptor [Oesophagostomum dentatum]
MSKDDATCGDEGRSPMHFMTFFNRTDAEQNDYWQISQILLITDLVLQFVSYFVYMVALYLVMKTMWHQTNMRNVWAVCVLQYMVSIIDRIAQIALVLFRSQESGGRLTALFLCTSYIRASCTFMVFFALPAIVMERCFATYFLEDYEKKQRPYLGYIIIGLMVVNAMMCSYTFHTATTTYGHVGAVFVVNTIAIAINKFNVDTNKRYYSETMSNKTTRTYSLGERYQIAENIKFCESSSCPKTHPEFVSVMSTLGNEAHVHQREHAAFYFDMLRRDWA